MAAEMKQPHFLNRAHKVPRPPFVGGGFTCKWLLMKVKEVRSWPNQMKVCGSPKSEDTSLCLPHPIIVKLATLGKEQREKVHPNQLERENPKNAHFEKGGSPACISNFGFMFDFYICSLLHLYHLISFVLYTCSLTSPFCPLLLRKCNSHCTLSTCFTLTFTLAFTSYCFTLTGP